MQKTLTSGPINDMIQKDECDIIFQRETATDKNDLLSILQPWNENLYKQSNELRSMALLKTQTRAAIRKQYNILYLDEYDTTLLDAVNDHLLYIQREFNINFETKYFRATTKTVCNCSKSNEIDISYNIARGFNAMINYWFNQIRIHKVKIDLFISTVDLLCDISYVISLMLFIMNESGSAIIKLPNIICDHITSWIYIAVSNFDTVYVKDSYLFCINFRPITKLNMFKKIFNKDKYTCELEANYSEFLENLKCALILDN